jgi:hypothetical protein
MDLRPLTRRLTAGAVALAILGSGLLAGGVAHAATPSGTFTPIDSSTSLPVTNGKDVTSLQGLTAGPCGRGTTAQPVDGFNAVVAGPGVFAPNAAAGRADGLVVVSTDLIGLSFTDPIKFTFRGTFKDFAQELGGSIVPGDYVITFRCVNQFDGVAFETYTATLKFTSATDFVVTNPVPPTPTPSTSPTPSPSATPTPSVTPTPTTSATPTPSTSPTPTPSGSPTPTPSASPTSSPTASPTPSPSTSATPTPSPSVSPSPTIHKTSTRLFVFACYRAADFPVILLSRTRPGRAEGTVQFKDGTAAIGAPQKVIYGFAFAVQPFAAGDHALTAAFTPDDPKAYEPSTSRPLTLHITQTPARHGEDR